MRTVGDRKMNLFNSLMPVLGNSLKGGGVTMMEESPFVSIHTLTPKTRGRWVFLLALTQEVWRETHTKN